MKNFFLLLLLTVVTILPQSAFSAGELFRSVASGNWNSTSTWLMTTNGGANWITPTSPPTNLSGSITIYHTVTVTEDVTADQIILNGGSDLSIASGITLTYPGNSSSILVSGSSISGAGTFKVEGPFTLDIRPDGVISAGLRVASGNVNTVNPNSPYTVKLYGNVTIDTGASINGGFASGRNLWIYGNLINNGTLYTSSGSGYLVIRGESLVNNGAITTPGSIYFDSTTLVTGAGSFTPAYSYIRGNVTLGSNITYTPGVSFSVENNAILNPGGFVFTLTNGGMFVNGNGEVSATGTVRTQNSVGISTDPLAKFNAALHVNTGTCFAYDDNSPYTTRLYGNVTIDTGATINGGGASGRNLWIYGNLINNGTLSTTSGSGYLVIRGQSLINNGAITTPGTIYFDSTTLVTGAGSFTPSNSYIRGNVTLGSNITYSPGSLFVVENNAILNPGGFVLTLTNGGMYVNGNGEVSATGTVRTQNSVGISTDPLAKFNAALHVNTGTCFAYDNTSPYTSRLYGNVTIDAGATINGGGASGRNLWIYGNLINNGTLTTTSGTGAYLVFKGSSLVNNGLINQIGSFYFDSTTSLSGTGSFTSHFILNGNAIVTLNGAHQIASVTINAGTVFNISNSLLKVSSSNPIGATGTFTTTGSTVEYNGSAAQTVSTAGITYSKLRINNASGTGLANNVTVNDSLIIQLGTLDLSGRILTISSTGGLLESPGNVVKGATGYLTTTRTIDAPSNLNVGGFGAVLTTASNLGSTEIRRGHTVQTGGSIKRYFDITPTNNSGLNATLKFKYDDSELNLRPEATLRLFKSTNSGTNWTNMGGSVNTTLNEITISGLTSFSRWTADSGGVNAVINFAIQGYYNSSSNRLNMEDTVRVYLRQISSPFAVVDSAVALLDSALLKAACVFPNATTGTYYIQIKHRNALESWSKPGGESYIAGNTLNYTFYSAAANAYGANQIQVDASPLRFAVYSGDVNQDGTIDATDLSMIDNDATNFLSGYIPTDVNGDRFADGTDYAIADNNAYNFISVARP